VLADQGQPSPGPIEELGAGSWLAEVFDSVATASASIRSWVRVIEYTIEDGDD
jgi:hypothetical protein